ncbi:MAG: hypothetical protein ABSH20_30295 [Tepidisphaeraceae bacterium]
MMIAATNRVRATLEEQQKIAKGLEQYRDGAMQRFKSQIPGESLDVLGSAGKPIDVDLKGKTIPQLYDVAKDIETTAHGFYRQFRVIELARIQGVSLRDSTAATRIAVPAHPDLDLKAFEHVIVRLKDPNRDILQAEIDKVRIEVASMVAAEQRMLDMVKGIMGDDAGGTIFGGGAGGVAAGGIFEGAGAAPMRRGEQFQGYSTAVGTDATHAWGVGVGPVTHRDEVFPMQKSMDLGRNLPGHGRKLVADASEQNTWMFVDSWYIIGPFPNPNREKIDYAFPPESSLDRGIDLDAVYIGWEGKPVRWQYRMSNALPVVPHQPVDAAIWYSYTEIYAEKDQERLCIFGSDDYGKAWMNGEVIFMSGKVPHPWIPDRGIGKVHFKKGFNPVLFKLENAWGRTGFSMCIYLGET